MTPEQQFSRWVRRALVVFALVFTYVVWMDLHAPLTTLSRVQRYVVQVAPQVAGEVTGVAVTNGDHVNQGDLLFTVAEQDYRLIMDGAELRVAEAGQDNAVLLADLAGARARETSAGATLEEARRQRQRLKNLFEGGAVSRQEWEQGELAVDNAESELESARAAIRSLETRLGEDKEHNLALAQAMNELEKARLDWSRTRITAPVAGVVDNLQLESGTYANAREPLVSLIADAPVWVAADFREKSLRDVHPGDRAEIVFDAWPGRVFEARVQSMGKGVRDGQGVPDGQLAQVENTDRWVRDAQRVRVRLVLEDSEENLPLRVGARTTVQLYPRDGLAWLSHGFGWLQIRMLSLLHYLY